MTLPKNHHKTPTNASKPHPILRASSAVDGDPQEFTIERVGADTFVAHFCDKDLRLAAAAGTPRTRDLDFAAWLGFERPRDVRKLIRRMESEGKLRGLDVRATMARTSMPHGGEREVKVLEYWLTREQALLVATQSDTPRAWALVEVMVKVFDGVLEMLRAPSTPSNDAVLVDLQRQVITLREILATQREIAAAAEQAVTARVVRLEAEIASGLLGPLKGAEIDRRLTSLSKRATAYSGRKWRSYRRSKANFLAHALGHVGESSSWRFLPAGKEEHAFRTLAAMEREADAVMEKAAVAAQDNLPAVPVTGKPAAEAPNPVALLHPRTGKRIEC